MGSTPTAAATALLALFVLATSVWVGGLVTLAVVARVTRGLSPPDRVQTFRGIGRTYGPIGAGALAVGLALGLVLSWDEPKDALFATTLAVAAALVVVTAVGVAQARAMTRLRLEALQAPGDRTLERRVRRGAGRASGLRALIAVLTLALVVLGSALAA